VEARGRGELAAILARAALLSAHPTRTAEVLGVADEDTVSQPAPKGGMECPAGLNPMLGEVTSELLEKGGRVCHATPRRRRSSCSRSEDAVQQRSAVHLDHDTNSRTEGVLC